jgi:hypothetical protein
MPDYTDFVQIITLLLMVAGAVGGLLLLGRVLVYSVQELVHGPSQIPVPAKPDRHRGYDGGQVKHQQALVTRNPWQG